MGTDSQKQRSHGELSAGSGIGEKVQQVSSINGRYKIDEEVKNSIGNVEVEELLCMTLGHELRGENAGGRGVQHEGE